MELAIDPERIKLAFFNVLYNAISYSIRGSRDIHVKVKSSAKHRIDVHISNWGYGVAKKDKEAIFLTGYSGESTRKSFVNSTGIGLSVAQKIFRLHGGVISIEKLHNPTTFRLTLPIRLDQ